MNKTIWLINAYAMPPYKEQRIQTLKRAEYLQKRGFEVFIITGSNFHNSDEDINSDNSLFVDIDYDGIKYIHVRTAKYKNSNLLRIYSLLQFYFKLFKIIKIKKKPDFISLYAAIPFSNIIYFLAKKYKCKLILDVVDLWPESLLELGLISKYNPLLWLSYIAEKWMYEKADLIVFSMEGGKDYLIEKKWDINSGGKIDLSKVKYINNGVDLYDFNLNKNEYTIKDIDLEDKNLFKVIYMGSIRLANGVDLLLDAAKQLVHVKDLKFLIYGSGPERIKIQNRINTEAIDNVILKQEWVELKYVPYILSKSSLNLLNYAKSKIWRFGGSQSKSFQYMASGKPIVSNVEMSYCPITRYNLGISKEFKSAKEYSEAILYIYSLNKEKYHELCNNSLIASRNYNYEDLTNKYIDNCLND
jgi:glycosyltransferase involved in cell wall biosynthesis